MLGELTEAGEPSCFGLIRDLHILNRIPYRYHKFAFVQPKRNLDPGLAFVQPKHNLDPVILGLGTSVVSYPAMHRRLPRPDPRLCLTQ